MSMRPVVLIPGGVMPAEFAYADLRQVHGPGVDLLANDHVVYAGEVPPAGYSLDLEVDAVLHAADEFNWTWVALVIPVVLGLAAAVARPSRDHARLAAVLSGEAEEDRAAVSAEEPLAAAD